MIVESPPGRLAPMRSCHHQQPLRLSRPKLVSGKAQNGQVVKVKADTTTCPTVI